MSEYLIPMGKKILYSLMLYSTLSACNSNNKKTEPDNSSDSLRSYDTIERLHYNYIDVYKDQQNDNCGKRLMVANDSVKIYNTCNKTMHYISLNNITDSFHYWSIFLPDEKHFREIGHIKLTGIPLNELSSFRYMIRVYNDTTLIGGSFQNPILKNYSPYLSDTAGRFMSAVQYFFDKIE